MAVNKTLGASAAALGYYFLPLVAAIRNIYLPLAVDMMVDDDEDVRSHLMNEWDVGTASQAEERPFGGVPREMVVHCYNILRRHLSDRLSRQSKIHCVCRWIRSSQSGLGIEAEVV